MLDHKRLGLIDFLQEKNQDQIAGFKTDSILIKFFQVKRSQLPPQYKKKLKRFFNKFICIYFKFI